MTAPEGEDRLTTEPATAASPDASLLTPAAAMVHLRDRGVLPRWVEATAVELSGGVSSVVILVVAGNVRLVVKQALPRLKVARRWLADPGRTVTEGLALRAANDVDPGAVPRVIDLDTERRILAVEAAPEGTADWRQHLLAGRVDPAVAVAVGTRMGRLHRGLPKVVDVEGSDGLAAFEQLRLQPYFISMIDDVPARRRLLMPYVERLRTARVCLTHGDLSPKNVLVGAGLTWLIDWEVAHLGDPMFDLAFILTHLLLKARHMPPHAHELRDAARGFLDAYLEADGFPVADHLVGLVGCLALARVDGRSPADYLSGPVRDEVRTLGLTLAASQDPGLDRLWRSFNA